MPWCDNCDAYQAPNALKDDGTCPTCAGPVDTADMKVKKKRSGRAPWHFWLMVIVLVVYLGYRLIQGIIWVSGHV
jgi:hypothetical protein